MLAYLLATIAGFSLGLLGGGGSILTVPILVYALGIESKLAIAMSLAIVGLTSLIGVFGHHRNGNVKYRIVAAFAPAAMIGSFLGAKSTVYMTSEFQMTLFAIVMLAASIMMFRKSSAAKVVVEANGGGSTAASNSNKPQNEQAPKKLNYLLISTQALAVGLLSGVIGVGGGFLIVPALVLLARISIKDAIGSSLLIIALNSGTGFVSYLSLVEIPWLFLFKFTAFSGVGILIGTRLVPHVKQEHLKKAFSVFLVLMGLFILGKNLF